jgi:PAS domain S-box-containing protein
MHHVNPPSIFPTPGGTAPGELPERRVTDPAKNGARESNRRILVIDDNAAIHADFRKILVVEDSGGELAKAEAELFRRPVAKPAKQPGFELASAYQGQEGLAAVTQAAQAGRPFAMAFVDVRMPPGWDGTETTARMWEVDPNLQIVICTAYSDYSWDEVIARLGASDRLVILKKPFDVVEVLQLANALTEKWRLVQESRRHARELEDTVRLRTRELLKSEERFRFIAENAAELITIMDAHGQRQYTSPSYERLLGYGPDELKAAPVFAHIHPEDREAVSAMARWTIEQGDRQVLEFRLRHKDGSWRTLESHNGPFRNAAGEIEGVLVVARDITERKQAEGVRQLLEVQLRHAQKLESIGRLAAGIAHEINTPLQFIGDNTRFIRDAFADLEKLLAAQGRLLAAAKAGPVTSELVAATEAAVQAADLDYLTAEIPKAIGQSLEGLERSTKIVRAMKEFSHPGSAHKAAVDLNQAIDSTITVCRNEWKYVADLVTQFEPDLPPVPVIASEFNQVVLNLIVNAAHAIGDAVTAGAKGTITISTRRDGDGMQVRVSDTGTGIPEEIRDKIFTPFFTPKGVGKGTGQGLAIARSVVVDKHGGTLCFETTAGRGTTFIIRLPLTERSSAKEANGTARPAAALAPAKEKPL